MNCKKYEISYFMMIKAISLINPIKTNYDLVNQSGSWYDIEIVPTWSSNRKKWVKEICNGNCDTWF